MGIVGQPGLGSSAAARSRIWDLGLRIGWDAGWRTAGMGVTAEGFRRVALALPEAEERSHMDHPDFRVRGKIFATLDSPEEGWGMVRLAPEHQARVVGERPGVFVPASGAWGKQGCTHVRL